MQVVEETIENSMTGKRCLAEDPPNADWGWSEASPCNPRPPPDTAERTATWVPVPFGPRTHGPSHIKSIGCDHNRKPRRIAVLRQAVSEGRQENHRAKRAKKIQSDAMSRCLDRRSAIGAHWGRAWPPRPHVTASSARGISRTRTRHPSGPQSRPASCPSPPAPGSSGAPEGSG